MHAIEWRGRVQRVSKRTNAFCHDEDEYDVHQTVKMSSFVWIWFMCHSFCVFFLLLLGGAACFIYGALSGQWLVMCMCEMRIKRLFENEMPHYSNLLYAAIFWCWVLRFHYFWSSSWRSLFDIWSWRIDFVFFFFFFLPFFRYKCVNTHQSAIACFVRSLFLCSFLIHLYVIPSRRQTPFI